MPVQFREGSLAEVRLWRGTENAPLEEPTVKITDKAEVECSGLEPGTKYFVRARRGESLLPTCRAASNGMTRHERQAHCPTVACWRMRSGTPHLPCSCGTTGRPAEPLKHPRLLSSPYAAPCRPEVERVRNPVGSLERCKQLCHLRHSPGFL